MPSNEKEQLQSIRRWKKEGTLHEHRADVVEAIQQHRQALFCEKVGYFLKDMSIEKWQQGHRVDPRLPALKPLKVAVIGSFTYDAYPHMLRSLLLSNGVWPKIYTAGYNQYVYELMDADSGLYRSDPDLVVCLLDEQMIVEEMPSDWSADDLEAACERKLHQLYQLLADYETRCSGLLMLHTIAMTPDTYHSRIDYKSKARISYIWRSFNNGLLQLAQQYRQVITVDADVIYRQHQVARLNDPRLAQYGGMNLGQEALFALADESVKVARSLLGLTKKALVLDLDNTLWGGVVGDDGIHGVQLGDTASGKTYEEFQRTIKQLKDQGVLLTVCSKNEEHVVREMFERHPHMQIKLEDVVLIMANWNPKDDNIRQIAKSLNIGLDSLVFIDDSPFERQRVRESLPEVTVPTMPDDAAYYKETLLGAGWFNAIKLTASDRERTNQYKLEVKREQLKQSSESMEHYLQSLGIEVEIVPADEFHLPRLAQLTMRTNQFNMTTRRYRESELGQMVQSGRYIVFGFRAKDRFGDYGLIGCMIIEKLAAKWRIENMMMSCRVFSRHIESAVLRHVLQTAKAEGMTAVYGEYIPTVKNVIVKDFYRNHGFELVKEEAEISESGLQCYAHTLAQLPEAIEWIRLISREEVLV